jgi:tRNA(Ile2) C34 agmatinyltransferase TiaS
MEKWSNEMIICKCGRRYTELGSGPPSFCRRCGRNLKKNKNEKELPVQIQKANFGLSFRLTRHIRRH